MKPCPKFVVGVVFTLALTLLSSHAVNRNWTGAVDTDWFNAGNWTGTPAGYPVSGDSARLGVVTTTPMPTIWPVYTGDNSTSPPTGAFTIAQVMNAWFTMASGVFTQASGTINLGNGGGYTGTWTHNGGSFTAQGSSMQIAPVANAIGNLTLNSGSITVNVLNVGTGAGSIATLTINSGLVYVNGTTTLNNSDKSGASATVLIGNGGIFDGNKMDFNKATLTILSGGVLRLRGVGQTVPLSIRSDNVVNLAGGDLYVGIDYTGTGLVEGWIANGRLTTSLPGHYVTYSYDSLLGFTRIYAVPERGTLGLFTLGGIGLMLLRRRR